MNLTTLVISCEWNHTIFVLLCLAYFVLHSVFKVCAVTCIIISFFKVWISSLYVYTTTCAHLVIHGQIFGLFYLLAIWVMLLYLSESLLSLLLGKYLQVELVDLMLILCLTKKKIYSFLSERQTERESTWTGRGAEGEKQTPHWAQSPMQGSIPWAQDYD